MSEQALIIEGADLFDGERMLGPHTVVVRGGVVVEIAPATSGGGPAPSTAPAVREQDGAVVIDARGLLLTPGLIDLHAHLRDPGQTWKEDIASGTAAAAAGGYTTVVCMPNTVPPVDTPAIAEYIVSRAAEAGRCRVLPAGCISRGRSGEELAELGGLYAAGVRLFSDDGSDTLRADVLLHAFEYLSMLSGARALIHAETRELAGGVMHEGSVSAALGQPGIPSLSEDIAVARAVLTALSASQPVQVTHVSSARSVQLVSFAKQLASQGGQPGLITADVTFNHLLLTDEAVREHGTLAKVSPPLRSEADRAALLAALAGGVFDAIVTDHAPHTADEKAVGMEAAPFGCAGFEIALGLLLGHVVGTPTVTGIIRPEHVLRLLTSAPADILTCRGAFARADARPLLGQSTLGALDARELACSPGRIAAGLAADLALIDPEAEWVIDPAQFKSKGRNTPFAGWTAKGRVLLTLCGGRITHSLIPGV